MQVDKTQYTPMMQQYLKIKEDYADAIVFFRLGDFYEMFFDDAIIASKVLEIALTSRAGGSDKIPMCGIPHHSVAPYLQKLIDKGFKVAIAEQVTEPGKGLVEREVIRLVTPGTVYEDNILNANYNNYIASLIFNEFGYLLTYVDISTGEAYINEGLTKDEVFDQIQTLMIREIIVNQTFDEELLNKIKESNFLITIFPQIINYNLSFLDNLSFNQKKGARHILTYLESTQKIVLKNIKKFEIENFAEMMKFDYKVKRHLEIFESFSFNKNSSLLNLIDKTKTAMGSRYLKYIMNRPLKDEKILNYRLDLIESFLNYPKRREIKDELLYIYDINRIVSRTSFESASPKDLDQLKNTLNRIPLIKDLLTNSNSKTLINLGLKIDSHDNLKTYLDQSIIDNPPLILKDGGYIKDNFNDDLDYLRNIREGNKSWLETFEQEEREKTNIKNLKVSYNKVFGYYIEITKGNTHLVDDSFGYERKQTLINSERYISKELKEKEDEILNSKEKALNLEYELFKMIRKETFKYSQSLLELAKIISEVDVFLNLAELAFNENYIRPSFNENFDVKVIEARHPVVEKNTIFIKNDVLMKKGEIFIITGPNMSGKSTYMRMYALIVYLAQIGSFVPASFCNIPIYDGLYTRIGSSDDISGGMSTFMVEMTESNEALQLASEKSLILFDEIGRGTATYDGMAIAQAIIEYIHEKIKAQTFFSTHYHEITELENNFDNITNLYVKASEEKNKMTFLHTVSKGKSDKSYGIQVAALANMPDLVLKRAKQILNILENNENKVHFDLFSYQEFEDSFISSLSLEEEKVLNELKTLKVEEMTPIDALNIINHLQHVLKKRENNE